MTSRHVFLVHQSPSQEVTSQLLMVLELMVEPMAEIHPFIGSTISSGIIRCSDVTSCDGDDTPRRFDWPKCDSPPLINGAVGPHDCGFLMMDLQIDLELPWVSTFRISAAFLRLLVLLLCFGHNNALNITDGGVIRNLFCRPYAVK